MEDKDSKKKKEAVTETDRHRYKANTFYGWSDYTEKDRDRQKETAKRDKGCDRDRKTQRKHQ